MSKRLPRLIRRTYDAAASGGAGTYFNANAVGNYISYTVPTDFLLKPLDHIEVGLRVHNLLKTRRAHLLLDNQRAAMEDAVRERTAELRQSIVELQKTNDLLSKNLKRFDSKKRAGVPA